MKRYVFAKIWFVVLFKEGLCIFSNSVIDFSFVSGDVGANLTLECGKSFSTLHQHPDTIVWVRDGKSLSSTHRSHVLPDGSLHFSELEESDAGTYMCSVDDEGGHDDDEGPSGGEEFSGEEKIEAKFKVQVRTPPSALVNVSVHASTVLALVMWEVGENGGYPLIHFQLQYRHTGSEEKWRSGNPDHISPNVRQIDIYHLEPNSSYMFQIWAVNKLGKGDISTVEATTEHDETEMELAHYLLEGAEDFDTRIWVVAVSIVMGTLIVLGVGTCFILYRECRTPNFFADEHETIELVPNIILNPGYNVALLDRVELDENSNDRHPSPINNNTVVQPERV